MKRTFRLTCSQCDKGMMTITIEFAQDNCRPCLENITEGDVIDFAKKILGEDTDKWIIVEIKEKHR